jgi:hypothetical protein
MRTSPPGSPVPQPNATRQDGGCNPSLDHLVGAGEQHGRHVKPEHLGGLQIDHQLVLSRGLHRKVCRLFAFQDAIDVAGRGTELADGIRPIGDQAAVVAEGRLQAACSGLPRRPVDRDDLFRMDLPSQSGRRSIHAQMPQWRVAPQRFDAVCQLRT